jgi:hypothetical protein
MSDIKNGLDISMRLLAIAARRDEIIGLLTQYQDELNDLTFEEQHLRYQQQAISADSSIKNLRNSQKYKAAYIKEVLDL